MNKALDLARKKIAFHLPSHEEFRDSAKVNKKCAIDLPLVILLRLFFMVRSKMLILTQMYCL